MFSDRLKLLKIVSCLAVVISCGLYYRFHAASNPLNDGYRQRICLLKAKILQTAENTYTAENRMKRFKILNVPDSIEIKPGEEYSIMGYINDDGYLVIERIRRNYPYAFKLVYSALTAVIMCSLFFIYFKISRKGFVPRKPF